MVTHRKKRFLFFSVLDNPKFSDLFLLMSIVHVVEPENAFIIKPHFYKLPDHNLDYKDVLTYVAVRSFNHVASNTCYPSYQTIADKACVSKKFVMQSVERLDQSGYLSVHKSKKARVSNYYMFKQAHSFDRVPYQIFKTEDLNAHERGMLLCLRQFFQGLKNLQAFRDIKDMAASLGLSYKTVYSQLMSLIEKGYIAVDGNLYQLSGKLNWFFINKSDKEAKEKELQFIIS